MKRVIAQFCVAVLFGAGLVALTSTAAEASMACGQPSSQHITTNWSSGKLWTKACAGRYSRGWVGSVRESALWPGPHYYYVNLRITTVRYRDRKVVGCYREHWGDFSGQVVRTAEIPCDGTGIPQVRLRRGVAYFTKVVVRFDVKRDGRNERVLRAISPVVVAD